MGCCYATRSNNAEEDFYTIGLNFIEEGTKQFDNCPLDKMIVKYM